MDIKDLNTPPTVEKFGKDPLEGTALCNFALFTLPKDFLTNLLPEELELAPQPFDVADTDHPVFVMSNATDLHFNLFLKKISQDQNIAPELRYHEFLLSIPYVQFKNKPAWSSQGPYIFMPVMYLNNIIAVLGGRIFYEFNKELAHIDNSDEKITVSTSDQLIIRENFTKTGAPGKAESFPNFNTISPIFALPVVEFGPYGYVKSIYTMDYENAEIQPGQMVINNLASPCAPKGIVSIPDISTSVFGAFKFKYHWSLSFAQFIEF